MPRDRSEFGGWRQSPRHDQAAAPRQAPVGQPAPQRRRPVVGITADLSEPVEGKPRATCSLAYARAVKEAGGVPIILPPDPAMAETHVGLLDAVVLTGGDDPRTEPFGMPTHPKATPIHPVRQAYETALLAALGAHPERPVLGVCLGMQMMALTHGGRLHQHLPDVLETAESHSGNRLHPITVLVPGALPPADSAADGGGVTSHHHQAVCDAGRLRVIARSADGVIEAIDDPARRFFIGVQWHPERTEDHRFGIALFRRLVAAVGD
ncbi:MAG: gamma-glutamyl-gamma-aminobutyrate hydrolase family protein [Phycisphaeraceae bacterium]|nr:gamma-glutamyl-gamma-aminobutyrate hydrolase family protein [Phycisphaeraceae bacterium]